MPLHSTWILVGVPTPGMLDMFGREGGAGWGG